MTVRAKALQSLLEGQMMDLPDMAIADRAARVVSAAEGTRSRRDDRWVARLDDLLEKAEESLGIDEEPDEDQDD